MTPGVDDDWYLTERDGIRTARCRLLDRCHRFGHGFSTRDAGGADRPEAVLAAAGLAETPLRTARQVHGVRIVAASSMEDGCRADGFLTAPGGPAAGVRTADCVPVLLADPVSGRGAVLHAGWKGTATGIVPLAVALLAGRGVAPEDLLAAQGPSIGGCCYQVGEEVVRAAGGAGVERQGDRSLLDLRKVIRMQLEAAGVPVSGISTAPWCTACDSGLFFSWRRDGNPAGRMLTVLGSTP